MGRVLSKVKDSITPEDKGNLIYKITCRDCDTVYVGETSRALTERIHEHRNLSKKVPKNMVEFENLETSSAIALHSIEHSHTINFNQPEILSKNWQIYRERIAAEQWFISNEPTSCDTKKKLSMRLGIDYEDNFTFSTFNFNTCFNPSHASIFSCPPCFEVSC